MGAHFFLLNEMYILKFCKRLYINTLKAVARHSSKPWKQPDHSFLKITIMKTKVLVLASLLLVVSASGALAGGKGRAASSLSELVKKEVVYPEFALDKKLSGWVDLYLVESENGPFMVVKGREAQLRAYVENCIDDVKDDLIAAFEKDNTSHYRLTFKYVR